MVVPSGARPLSWGLGSGSGSGTGLEFELEMELGTGTESGPGVCAWVTYLGFQCQHVVAVRRFGVRVAFHVYINKSQRFSRLTYCNLCLVTALYRRKTNFNHLLFSINELPPPGMACG